MSRQLQNLIDSGTVRLCRQTGPLDEQTASAVLEFVELLRDRQDGA